MPLRWYLAQGLIPLGPSSSDDEEGPCTLPNGKIVCGPHGLAVCGKCCTAYSWTEEEDEDDDDDGDDDDRAYDSDDSGPMVCPHGLVVCGLCCVDYSFMDDIERDEKRGESPTPPMRKGTGRVLPTKFTPPSASVKPVELFTGRSRGLFKRYTLPTDPGKFLVHTDGCCLNNGQPNPRAGWAVWHGDFATGAPTIASGRLERKGPFGDDAAQTSNRAELRAVIAALRFQPPAAVVAASLHTMVVATDSEYAVEGSTKWARKWIKDGWVRRVRGPRGVRSEVVKNRDLWEALLGEVERCEEARVRVEFWRIPREWNARADAEAKAAAARNEAPEEWNEEDD
ncbi:ribonuclease H-like domain-containing protein [Coniochaeta sp. 2T2.1]|nr:ribonuclease H-like domain-containing protein [Coniochaeta sp. 2T2.1]